MKQVLTDIAKAIVDAPESVVVTEREEGDNVFLELMVASDDMGKVIGKRGKIANAIRTVVKATANRDSKRVIVNIVSDAE
ncbi:MAG: KH domain-containing protein [Ruminococcaceae bacterium]|nr:KH domain-containing protein [Oscillospiraceae bacterium]